MNKLSESQVNPLILSLWISRKTVKRPAVVFQGFTFAFLDTTIVCHLDHTVFPGDRLVLQGTFFRPIWPPYGYMSVLPPSPLWQIWFLPNLLPTPLLSLLVSRFCSPCNSLSIPLSLFSSFLFPCFPYCFFFCPCLCSCPLCVPSSCKYP